MFECQTCGKQFTVPEATLAKYPGWKPKQCMTCKSGKATATKKPSADSPSSGIFTDGGSSPNPGPGGWAAVHVIDDKVIAERSGRDPDTTNNRMELTALINGYEMAPPGPITMYSDSELCVNTVTKWAPNWERNGWRKKDGEIKNLDLVKKLYALAKARPDIELKWIKAHAGLRWNEYADHLVGKARAGA